MTVNYGYRLNEIRIFRKPSLSTWLRQTSTYLKTKATCSSAKLVSDAGMRIQRIQNLSRYPLVAQTNLTLCLGRHLVWLKKLAHRFAPYEKECAPNLSSTSNLKSCPRSHHYSTLSRVKSKDHSMSTKLLKRNSRPIWTRSCSTATNQTRRNQFSWTMTSSS